MTVAVHIIFFIHIALTAFFLVLTALPGLILPELLTGLTMAGLILAVRGEFCKSARYRTLHEPCRSLCLD